VNGYVGVLPPAEALVQLLTNAVAVACIVVPDAAYSVFDGNITADGKSWHNGCTTLSSQR
jgi:hypothetical protein